MNVQKEDFELNFKKTEIYRRECAIRNKDILEFSKTMGGYFNIVANDAWSMWQAAKADAVPEEDKQVWATVELTWKDVAFRALSCKILKTTDNWVHVKNLVGVGSTTASLICKKIGVDPHGKKFELIESQEKEDGC